MTSMNLDIAADKNVLPPLPLRIVKLPFGNNSDMPLDAVTTRLHSKLACAFSRNSDFTQLKTKVIEQWSILLINISLVKE